MRNEIVGKNVLVVIIAGRKMKEQLLPAISERGGKVVNTFYGHGTVKASFLQDALGLVVESNKIVVTCLMNRDRVNATLKMLENDFGFSKPNTGIAFTVPLEGLSF